MEFLQSVQDLFSNFYFEYWLRSYLFILAVPFMYFGIFAFEYRLNSGSRPLWEGFKEELSWYSPGGIELRIARLDRLFWRWEEDMQSGISHSSISNWDSLDYGRAVQSGDRKTLIKMTSVLGSGYYFWVGRTFIACILAIVLPPVFAVVLVSFCVAVPIGFLSEAFKRSTA